MEKLKYLIIHLPYYLKLLLTDLDKMKSGLLKIDLDPRNFKIEKLFEVGYTPKSQKVLITTKSIKNQGSFNNCTWNAATVQKEIDENVELSVRSLTAQGYQNGLISGNGFANLESPQKVLKNIGIVEQIEVEENVGWSIYVNLPYNPLKSDYAKHKSQSYWEVGTKDAIIKLLDDGHLVTTGIDWYTAFNQGGGFSFPWIIAKALGYKVGGHSVVIIGYDLNYHGYKVFICQNSYGAQWGDAGKFYIAMDYLIANNYGFFTNLDVTPATADFLNKYDGLDVKGGATTVWLVQKGKKKAYPDFPTFLSYNRKVQNIVQLTGDEEHILSFVPSDDNMDITKSDFYFYIKDIKTADDSGHELIQALLRLEYQKQMGLPLSI